jgi:POT family proton-dependent oligopeptide transporter
MSSLPVRRSETPHGAGALFFIQIFSTLGYAVLYSSLVLYATRHLHFSDQKATAIMGVFGAFNYGLHLFGGYLGGRFLSNRNLFIGGMVLQVFGCACIAGGTEALMYWGLALFLTGSGLNVTCVNMMLTQRYAPEDTRRESAFLWNYAGMNLGFFIGFTVAGIFQSTEDYRNMFLFATIGNALAIVVAAANWKRISDLHTPLLDAGVGHWRLRFAVGIAILVGLVPLVWVLLQYTDSTETIIKVICGLVAAALVWLTIRHPDRLERNNMWAYLILTLGSLVFWSLYQMAPSGLQLFAVRNVDLVVWGVTVSPQWIQNINTVVIVVGGPFFAWAFERLRARGWMIDVPRQFAVSLLLMGAGFLCLPAGIHEADARGLSNFGWLFWSYVFQALGELLISPIGYAMIGKLAPRQYQGIMMGSWMLVTGLASLFANDFSAMIPEATGSPAATNEAYFTLFSRLGWGSVAVGGVLVALIPFLRRLIRDKETPEVEALVPVVQPR